MSIFDQMLARYEIKKQTKKSFSFVILFSLFLLFAWFRSYFVLYCSNTAPTK